MDPNRAPIVLVSTISIGNGNEPPLSWTSNSLAFSALKLPLIVADPPVIPVLANWLPTLASLIDSPSRIIANSWLVPAIDFVISANFSPPELLKVNKTSQLLFVCSCLLPALIRSLPDKSVLINKFVISLSTYFLISINFPYKSLLVDE